MIMSKQTDITDIVVIRSFLLFKLDCLLKESKLTLDDWLKLSEMAKSSDSNISNLVYQIIKTKDELDK